jgi:hypothetical protein
MWQELGIEPTADPRAIRAAYARHLKDIDPGRDLEAFQRLRQAYEVALASLRNGFWVAVTALLVAAALLPGH